jgi:uncharacterized protein (DUF305 family)
MLHRVRTRIAAAALGCLATSAGCATAQRPAEPATVAMAVAPRHTAADTRFMQGMIGHHAQATVMAVMAPTHGAGERVAVLASRILRSQRDEIDLMQTWLRDRGEAVPDPRDPMAGMDMSRGHEHMTPMPGMLTAEQLARLDAARGAEFDRLFLTYMIQHHEGAITMVAALFASPRGGQEPELFGFASGVDADQRAEIERMRAILAAAAR